QSIDHDTRLYISHDAPHQGAHVPTGAQAMMQHMGSYLFNARLLANPLINIALPGTGSEYLLNVMNMAERPAAAQMLIYHYNSNLRDEHTDWMETLDDMGYPTLCRNVA